MAEFRGLVHSCLIKLKIMQYKKQMIWARPATCLLAISVSKHLGRHMSGRAVRSSPSGSDALALGRPLPSLARALRVI
jgi:hypothetical protein